MIVALIVGCLLQGCGSNSQKASSSEKSNSSETIESTKIERPTKTVQITNDQIFDGNILINKYFNRFNMVNPEMPITVDNIGDGTNVKT